MKFTNTTKKGKANKPVRQALLDPAVKEQMMAVILRNASVFERVRDQIKAVDLYDLDVSESWTWRASCIFWDKQAKLPTRQQLTTELQQLIKAGHNQINEVEIERIQEFVDLICDKTIWEGDLRTDPNYALWALQTFTRWKQEMIVARAAANLVIQGTVPADVVKSLQDVQAEIAEVAASLATDGHKTLGEEWQEHQARLKQYRNRTMVGLKTGLSELDKRTLGLRGLFLLGAKPGAGKTSFAGIQVAIGVCSHFADNDAVVVVVSLDMDRFELYRRIECNLADIGWKVLMFGSPEETRAPGSEFSEEHQVCLKQGKSKLKASQLDKRLMILDRSNLGDTITAQRLSAIMANAKNQAMAKRALLLVDYLQLLPVPDDVAASGDLAADKYRVRLVQQVIEHSRTVEDPLGDTAVAISEARKPANAKHAWGDAMSELMGSARLGYAADAVLLYREMSTKEIEQHYGVSGLEAANKRREILKAQGIAPVTLILEKGRDGMTRGKWSMEFYFEKSVFVELNAGAKIVAHAKALLAADAGTGNGKAAQGLPTPLPAHLQGKASKGKKSPALGSDGASAGHTKHKTSGPKVDVDNGTKHKKAK